MRVLSEYEISGWRLTVAVQRRRRALRPGWKDVSISPGKGGQRRHHVSGWEVHHCGHPTSHWPWQVLSPSGVTEGPSGSTFARLTDAMAAVEGAVRHAR